MDAKPEKSDEALGLKLIRAFLSLPPEKRAQLIAFVEQLAQAQSRPDEGKELSRR